MKIAVDKVALGQGVLGYFDFPPSVSYHNLFKSILIPLVSNGQTGEAWEPFEYRGALDKNGAWDSVVAKVLRY